MCSHSVILMAAAMELAEALRHGAEYAGIYRCETCTHMCRLSLTYRDAQPEITIGDLDHPGSPVVYSIVAGAFIRIDPP